MSVPKLNLMKTSFWTLQYSQFQFVGVTVGVGLCLVGGIMYIVLKIYEHDAFNTHLDGNNASHSVLRQDATQKKGA